MAEATPNVFTLKLGPGQGIPSPRVLRERTAALERTLRRYVPDFVAACAGRDQLTIHQDAFAAGYHYDEYTLLGMAIKYAGIQGVDIAVVGNPQALNELPGAVVVDEFDQSRQLRSRRAPGVQGDDIIEQRRPPEPPAPDPQSGT